MVVDDDSDGIDDGVVVTDDDCQFKKGRSVFIGIINIINDTSVELIFIEEDSENNKKIKVKRK